MGFHWRLLTPLLVLAALSACRDIQHEVPEASALVYKIASQWGSEGDGPGEFDGLQGLAVDADAHNSRVQKFDAEGRFLSATGTGWHLAGAVSRPR